MKVQINKKVPNFNVSVTGKDQLNSKDLLGKKLSFTSIQRTTHQDAQLKVKIFETSILNLKN